MKKYIIGILSLIFCFSSISAIAEDNIKAVGLAAYKSGGKLAPYEYDLRAVGDNDILIDILYAGICHSDVEIIDNAFDIPIDFPYVSGHEIVGRVSKIGKKVKGFKTGDIVAVGSMVDSCGKCEFCKINLEQHCTKGAQWTGGGFSTKIVVKDKFVLHLPKSIDIKKAAPLLCAGITVYSPIMKLNIKKGDKIAVAGMGGLGHLAVKYLVSMGADVTVFEITDTKEKAAYDMGAEGYVNVNKAPECFNHYNGQFKAVIDTIPAKFDLQSYIDILKDTGTFVLIGMPPIGENILTFDSHTVTSGGKKIMGSSIGGMKETDEMLKYSAKHKIYPDVEVISADYVNTAFERIKKGDVHFRFVIDTATIKL